MTSTAEPRLLTPAERVRLAYRRITASARTDVWIHLRAEAEALADADEVQRRLAAGERLVLAGVTVSVKDNIDVEGLPTTAACPGFAYRVRAEAPAVTRLKAAGAIVVGKGNLDQFATGLTGTRSPYGSVADAQDPARVAGGSSSGSAVAVALRMADLGLATDTAGSGRVPAAFQGIVGVKPTRGLIPTRGVVPACRSFDCVSVLARDLAVAEVAARVMVGPDPEDSSSRRTPEGIPAAAPSRPRIAIATNDQTELLSPAACAALGTCYDRVRHDADAELVPIDVAPFLRAGELLYGGAFVAERYAGVGGFIEAHRDAVDPHVADIILGGASVSAAEYVRDLERLALYRLRAEAALQGCDALLLPTVPFQPTFDDVRADPIAVNQRIGTYSTFCNLLDMCAIALPAGTADGGRFGVTLFAPAFHDLAVADLARRLTRSRS